MTTKRLALGLAAIVILLVVGVGVYFLQLTAPVPVSNTLPVAPTLADPATAPAAAQAASGAAAQPTPAGANTGSRPRPSTETPGGGRGAFPSGTPGSGFPPFPGGTPPAGMPGFRPGGGPPPGGGFGNAPVSTAVPAAPTLAPASGGAQVYHIDASQSKASYSVSETFLQDFMGMKPGQVTTVGTTRAIAGDILIDPQNPAAAHLGTIVVDISQLTSDISMRDNAIRRQWLDSAQYPLATFANAKITGLPATWPQGQPVQAQISGDLTVHNATKPVTWDATITLNGTTLQAQATTTVNMSDFGVTAPSMPMLTVKDPATLTLNLVATPGAK